MQIEYWRHYLRARAFEWLHRHDDAFREYRRLAQLDPANARVLSSLGYRHAAREQWQEAARYFAEAIAILPHDAAALFNLGFAREKLGKLDEAVAAFTDAVALQPRLDRAWYGLGMCQAKLGRHEEAVKALTEAAALQPMNGIAWYALGMAHHATCSPEKVEEVVRHLHRFDPVMTRQLIRESGRSDLAHLVRDLRV